MTNYEELPTDVENELADFHANPNSNGRDSGPDETAPDEKRERDILFQTEVLKLAAQADKKQSEYIKKKEAIREVADLLVDKFDVSYDWHEVLEIELDDGRWVKVTLEEIADPTPEAEDE